MRQRLLSGVTLALLVCAQADGALAAPASWPQFRGPDGQGHADTTGLPLRWSETENIAWKTSLPGSGHSSPVIEGNRIWLTSAVVTEASAEDVKERLKTNTGSQPLVVAESVSLRALCVDRTSGELLQDIELGVRQEPQWVHTLNTYASPTPIIEGGRLYCHFGSMGTFCLDTKTGEVMWSNDELQVLHENGPGSTAVLWGDRLIFHCDGSDQQFIAALDKQTGKVAWKTPRSGKMHENPQLKKAYGTPLIVEIDGRPQVVSPAANWLYGYDPASGKELWKVNYGVLGFSIVPRPIVGHGMIYVCTSFMKSEILAIRYADAPEQPYLAWRFAKQAPQKPSPLLVGDELYFVGDKGGVATCLDAISGKVHWQQRIAGNHSASPLYADGRVHFFSHEGVTTVIAPGKTYQPLAKNTLDGSIMASPAAVHGALYLRTDKALYGIQANSR